MAKELGIEYIDTGAMYRAIGLKLIKTDTDMNDEKALVGMLEETSIDFSNGRTILDGVDVSGQIRTEEVSAKASACSALAPVRAKLVDLQRKMAASKSVIMDGRDIGTNVIKDAEVKIFLTAAPEERARRRYDELTARGLDADYDKVLADINARDYNDTHRKLNPLTRAEDAVEIDSTDMSIDEVTAEILSIAEKH